MGAIHSREVIMKRLKKLDNLLARLRERIFVALDHAVPLVYAPGSASTRAAMVGSDRKAGQR